MFVQGIIGAVLLETFKDVEVYNQPNEWQYSSKQAKWSESSLCAEKANLPADKDILVLCVLKTSNVSCLKTGKASFPAFLLNEQIIYWNSVKYNMKPPDVPNGVLLTFVRQTVIYKRVPAHSPQGS